MVKTRKLSLLEKAVIVGAGILKLASPANAQEAKLVEGPIEPNVPYKQVSEDSSPKVTFDLTYASNYAAYGFIMGGKDPLKKGGVIQPGVTIDFENGFSLMGWGNYDLQDGRTGNGLHEIDAGAAYNVDIDDNTSAGVTLWRWEYPSRVLGDEDHAINVNVSHTLNLPYVGSLDTSVDLYHLFKDDDVDSGDALIGAVSKTLPVGKVGDLEVSVTPGVDVVHLSDFYSVSGLAAVTPGISIDVGKDNWSLSGFVKEQDGDSGMPDATLYGITFSISN